MFSFALSLLADAAPSVAPQPPGGLLGNPLFMLLPMVAIFYFLLIRPQNQRQRELQNMRAALKTGDKVVTAGGIHGIVANVKDGSTLSLKIADNVKIEVEKSKIEMVERSTPATASKA